MASTRICLVRHGETSWNSERRIQGQIDIDLNATGEAQARALRSALAEFSFAAAYSSDLMRAWRTAGIATADLGLALTPLPALRERHFGVLQGVAAHEAAGRHPEAYRHHQARSPEYRYETGESLVGFAERALSALEALAQRHPGVDVLVFTHGGVLDAAYRAATGKPLQAPRDFPLGNAAINWIEHQSGAWRLVSWGDSRHLQGVLDEVA